MKKIVITQRRDAIAGRDEERDATDVKIGKIFFDLGFLPIFLCSEIEDKEKYIKAINPDGIMIGSGNDIGEYPKRDNLEFFLLDFAKENNLPVFAICKGTQTINNYLGGTLEKVTGQVATRVKITGAIAQNYGHKIVNSYHNFAITKNTISKDLLPVAFTDDYIVKAIKHKTLPWLGIMWHPEREQELAEEDKKLISDIFNKELKW